MTAAYPKSASLGEHGNGFSPAFRLCVILLHTVEDGQAVMAAESVHLPQQLNHSRSRPVLSGDGDEVDEEVEVVDGDEVEVMDDDEVDEKVEVLDDDEVGDEGEVMDDDEPPLSCSASSSTSSPLGQT